MPVVTLRPPKRSSPVTSALRFAWSAITGDPIGAIQAARDLAARREETIEYLLSPVIIDTDRGTVRIPVNALQKRADNGEEFAPKLRGLNVAKLARENEPLLQATWTTGNVQPGIHWAYANAAPIIAALRIETDGGPATETPPEQAEPTTFMNLGSIRRLDPMATIPPGGMAAFSQQTVANKLALTRGMKRSTTRRRKKKAVGASGRKRKKAKSNRKKAGKLKFGSPAWQRKYNKRYKRKRG